MGWELSHRKRESEQTPRRHRFLGDTSAACPYVHQRRDEGTVYSPTESRSPRTWRMVRMDSLSEQLCNENTGSHYEYGCKRRQEGWSGTHVETAGLYFRPLRNTSCDDKCLQQGS